ncbi:hypothetical protein MZM54_04445 [[Brevibacterium] frigoritolerans]|nr:hypothetical protein [Peribacillus frigoritolerans]
MLRKGVKIFKFINQRSALDVTHNLGYYKEKPEKDEKEYKGNIVISITASNQYLKAYIAKSKAKSLFQSIVDGNFSKLYPAGYEDYGGSMREGKIIARILKIETLLNPDKKDPTKKKVQIRFTISEGPGQKTQTGAFKMLGKPTTYVQSYLDPLSMRECALEVISYIQTAEIAGQLIGKPLHTLTNVSYEDEKESGLQNLISSSNENFQTMMGSVAGLTNEDLIKLINAVNSEYKKRVRAYKQNTK